MLPGMEWILNGHTSAYPNTCPSLCTGESTKCNSAGALSACSDPGCLLGPSAPQITRSVPAVQDGDSLPGTVCRRQPAFRLSQSWPHVGYAGTLPLLPPTHDTLPMLTPSGHTSSQPHTDPSVSLPLSFVETSILTAVRQDWADNLLFLCSYPFIHSAHVEEAPSTCQALRQQG